MGRGVRVMAGVSVTVEQFMYALIELAGLALLTTAGFIIALPLGLALLGLACLWVVVRREG